jgi:hypothetical protein
VKKKTFLMAIGSGVLSLFLTGCVAWTTSPPVSLPYFVTDKKEVTSFQSLVKKHEGLVSRCVQSYSCEQVYFTLGLLGLYESREVAAKYFEKVLAVAPMGPIAGTSKAWLQVLQEPVLPGQKGWPQSILTAPAIAEAHASLAMAADRLVRNLLDDQVLMQQFHASKDGESEAMEALQRELAERDRKIETLLSKKDLAKVSADPVVMQKQLAERDKKIEELSSQLEALKRIDQEMREKVRPIRPPLTTVPIPSPETTP